MKILIALDDSPVSAHAARVAAALFAGRPDTEFLVINVSPVPTMWVGGAASGAVGPMILDPRWLKPSAEDEADDERQLMHEAAVAGVPDPEPLVLAGDPVRQICTAATEHGVDVIVVGSHDKSALRRLFDPSVAAGVVRDTYLPVLVVSGKPPKRK